MNAGCGQDTYQESTDTMSSNLSCKTPGERPSASSSASVTSPSSPANGSSWYGLTSEKYLATSSSDDSLSESTEETKEPAALYSAIALKVASFSIVNIP